MGFWLGLGLRAITSSFPITRSSVTLSVDTRLMEGSSAHENTVKHFVHYLNGLPVPPFVTQHQIDSMKEMELFPDDIWVTTYPRSGTTWTQQIVRNILSKGDDAQIINQAVPWLEAMNSKLTPYHDVDISVLEHPRAFKSHMPYNLMPCGLPSSTPCKYIYVARNPKDVAVSYFYHYFTLKLAENLDWDTFISWFVSGDLQFGDYFDHVLSWWEHRNSENVLFMKYEDMKKDIRSSVIRIASFTNKELSEKEISSVIEKSSFSSMKKNPTTNYEWVPKEVKHPEGTPFMRKGVVGGWKEHFSPEQSAQFDVLYDQKFKPVEVELKFE